MFALCVYPHFLIESSFEQKVAHCKPKFERLHDTLLQFRKVSSTFSTFFAILVTQEKSFAKEGHFVTRFGISLDKWLTRSGKRKKGEKICRQKNPQLHGLN